MSGDVQPRKRKEKKKRKEDGHEETQQQLHQYHHTTPTITDDVNIHVEKEVVTGGGVCAKIVFFFLLTALAVLIGLIITEHRELTDLDTVDTDSRFSKIFAGWTDNSLNDEHLEETDLTHADVDSGEEASEHDETEEEEEEEEQDVASDEEEEEEEQEEEETEEQPEDEEEETDSVQDDDESVNVSQPEDEEGEEDDDEQSEETYEESEEQQQEEEADNEDGSDEVEQAQSEEAADSVDDVDDDEESAENDESEEAAERSEEIEREERDASEENATGEAVDSEDASPTNSGTGSDSGSSAKIAGDDAPPVVPDLSRRNTIVPPPSLEEVEPDMENVEEDYSEEEVDEESDENSGPRPSAAKQKYRELQSTYSRSRSFTPDKQTDEGEESEEEVEDEDEDDEISDDEELLKKLEAKYGKLRRASNDDEDDDEEYDDEEGDDDEDDNEFFTSWKRVNVPKKEAGESDSEKEENRPSGAQSVYDYVNITNTADYAIRDELDEAQREINNNTAFALKLFDAILQHHPSSPRALYGKAQALDALAEQRRSNDILQQAISMYIQALNTANVPDTLFQTVAERCIQRMYFIGRYGQAISVHQMLIKRFPNIPKFRNQLAVTYLTINKIENARRILQETLTKWPNNGVALVHYGFILKTTDGKLAEAVYYMRKGIKTREEGVIDGRFYFHLGDAMARLGRTQQAMELYEEGVKEKVFLSKYQRSLYNVPRLTGKPWWRKNDTPYRDLYKTLESRWTEIRDEGLAVLNQDGYFKDESENLKDMGDWKQFELYARGMRNIENCKKCPITCQIIASLPDASGCKRGQSKFSVIHPGTHVWPHCGPTNCRLRVHLGLKVPPETYIRVAEETRSWEEGKVFIFDDSFEHEVWHNGTEFRLVLIVDVWHPELTMLEKKTLSPI